MRTPLGQVRGLGAARSGTDHFWLQRLTAVSNLVLSTVFVGVLVSLAGDSHASVVATLSNPIVAILMLLFVISVVVHMRIGMQVIIEDYVHAELPKLLLLMGNTFFAIVVGLSAVFALLKISFGV
ncbi:succinate dehydrogenase / fumarate reductase membrane anchor subunit [Methylopila capsulata]|uniref:Succinate dehydrogenase hydrophobic membrane anchor subunit n=1 Tax=Methylopila capsulata TaxID=61654 RepID=A0A9W6IXF7_9HYPH|nr:succinate dehydrogenase, hydrophobic membrane anchor protein [Methylopila capsulata]MBM7853375.1 succinate dehydrogenase / fumarate reductase membrane anchor subunit [Methylopila capsulata]GLK57412.1 succinate dehydrogenase, hydrophobic membrane anchor protein [Methylopila capsulata]